MLQTFHWDQQSDPKAESEHPWRVWGEVGGGGGCIDLIISSPDGFKTISESRDPRMNFKC